MSSGYEDMPEKGAKMSESIYFNGINGKTGEYGLRSDVGGRALEAHHGRGASRRTAASSATAIGNKGEAHLGVKEGVDPKKLDEAGWGVVFARGCRARGPRRASRLFSSCERNKRASGSRSTTATNGYRPGESKGAFLARHGVGPGPADPERVPYYLILVGSPEAIPYPLSIAARRAVRGRENLTSTRAEDYANYAQSVVAAETRKLALERRVCFFGVTNPDDRATELSRKKLVAPLIDRFQKKPDWQVEAFLDGEATKANLTRILGWRRYAGAPLQRQPRYGVSATRLGGRSPHQGALLCQEWPGPKAWRGKGALPQDFYFAGDDLT